MGNGRGLEGGEK